MSLLCNNGPHGNFPLLIWCPRIHTASHFLPRAGCPFCPSCLPSLPDLPFLTCFVILTNLSASSSSKVALSHSHSFLDIILRDNHCPPPPRAKDCRGGPLAVPICEQVSIWVSQGRFEARSVIRDLPVVAKNLKMCEKEFAT